MVFISKKLIPALIVFLMLNFIQTSPLMGQSANGEDVKSSNETIDEQLDDDFTDDAELEDEEDGSSDEDLLKKIQKPKKYRKTKMSLSPEDKREKLIQRELKRHENAVKTMNSREKKAKKILKKVEVDREKELIKHDRRIEEIKNMKFK